MSARLWLPEPEPGTQVALGFDGSDVDDWTALRAETRDGHQFTPRYGPEGRPTIWKPAEWPGDRVPREQVHLAVAHVFDRFKVARFYYDPPRWGTDGEQWALKHGDDVVAEWATYRPRPMHEALDRFMVDLHASRITQDGCPLTWLSMENAVRVASKTADRYGIGKPSQSQKIDPTMASVLAHEAASDARAAGWPDDDIDTRVFCFT
jgi:phage terminase large subunit-like protein